MGVSFVPLSCWNEDVHDGQDVSLDVTDDASLPRSCLLASNGWLQFVLCVPLILAPIITYDDSMLSERGGLCVIVAI